MTQAEYLEAEFLRYYPRANVTVDDDEEEKIHVHVTIPVAGEPDRFILTSFVMEVGSDDDCYHFTRRNGDSITIPLMPEQSGQYYFLTDEERQAVVDALELAAGDEWTEEFELLQRYFSQGVR